MRLSEWRDRAPSNDATASRVNAVVDTALATLGAEADPECWVAWGDDPSIRYLIFAPTPAGLIQLNVRVSVPGEGARAGGKVVRWSRVQLGELGVEIQGGHRLVTFQVETQVLNGADESADKIATFAQALFSAVDGRLAPAPPAARAASPAKRAAAPTASASPSKQLGTGRTARPSRAASSR